MSMDIEKVKMIVAIAEEKSYKRAAKRLHIPLETITNFCDSFEKQTGTPILEKGLIDYFLSPQGYDLYEKAKQTLQSLENLDQWVHDIKTELAGTITIVTMPLTGIEWLMPRLKPFLEKYSKVSIRMILKNPPILPGEGDVIIGLPMIGPTKGAYSSRELIKITYSLYASPDYLEKYGTPLTTSDLDNHKLITFGFASNFSLEGHFSWSINVGREEGQPKRQSCIEVDSTLGTLKAARLGLGIAELRDDIEYTDLIKILPELQSAPGRVDYIVERRREDSPLLKELYKHLRSYDL